jgi:hypothetical protein
VLVRGSSYMAADSRALIYKLTGVPAFTVNAPCYWRGTGANGLSVLITGTCTAVDTMQFEATPAITALLASGSFSLSTNFAVTSDVIKTPNDTLTILESL